MRILESIAISFLRHKPHNLKFELLFYFSAMRISHPGHRSRLQAEGGRHHETVGGQDRGSPATVHHHRVRYLRDRILRMLRSSSREPLHGRHGKSPLLIELLILI